MSYYGKTSTFQQDTMWCKECMKETEITHNRDESFCSECGMDPKNAEAEKHADTKALGGEKMATLFLKTRKLPEADDKAEDTVFENRPDPKNPIEECEHGYFYISHPCAKCGTVQKPQPIDEKAKTMVAVGFGVEMVDPEKWHNQGQRIKNETARVLICGGRDYTDGVKLFTTLDKILDHGTVMDLWICHGGARGADRAAGAWAKARKVPVTVFEAMWEVHGKAAGMIRNRKMLVDFRPALVIAFPGGVGTKGMVDLAKAAGVKVIEVK